MKNEQKELLLKDLCGRLPYCVKCAEITPDTNFINKNLWEIVRIKVDLNEVGVSNCYVIYGNFENIDNIKPYLFPMSSMTEELREEHKDLLDNQYSFDANGNVFTLQDFYCKYHIDYRGLISMGLALDATGLKIY